MPGRAGPGLDPPPLSLPVRRRSEAGSPRPGGVGAQVTARLARAPAFSDVFDSGGAVEGALPAAPDPRGLEGQRGRGCAAQPAANLLCPPALEAARAAPGCGRIQARGGASPGGLDSAAGDSLQGHPKDPLGQC